MSADHDAALCEFQWIGLVVYMSMGCIDRTASEIQDRIVCHDREIKDHLVNFRVAVSTDTEKPVRNSVEHCDDFLWIVVFGKLIPWSVIKYVSQKKYSVGFFHTEFFNEFLAVIGGTMEVRGDDPFHVHSILKNFLLLKCGKLNIAGL